jgi:hypothetical protein
MRSEWVVGGRNGSVERLISQIIDFQPRIPVSEWQIPLAVIFPKI